MYKLQISTGLCTEVRIGQILFMLFSICIGILALGGYWWDLKQVKSRAMEMTKC